MFEEAGLVINPELYNWYASHTEYHHKLSAGNSQKSTINDAKWDEITVEVDFDANGGQISQESQAVVLGGNYTLITPVKLGYKFDGWYDGDNLVNLEGT